jgi:ferredoxin-type protein NapF
MAAPPLYSRRAFLTGHRAAEIKAPHGGECNTPIISAQCLPRRGVACMSCRDACPAEAIRFRPRAGGPFLPEIDAHACSGCGDCVRSCPADALAMPPREAAHG